MIRIWWPMPGCCSSPPWCGGSGSRACATRPSGSRGRTGGFQPGRKILTLVHALVAGAIPHRPRRHVAGRVDGQGVAPPGHGPLDARDLPACLHLRSRPSVRKGDRGHRSSAPGRSGRAPVANQLVVDIDSTIREVFGKLKEGAAYGYTKVLGYHPILATRADTGEILHARLRKGSANTARGDQALRRRARGPPAPSRCRRARSSCASTRATGPMRPSRCSVAWGSPTPWRVRTGTKAFDNDHRRDSRVELGRHRVPRRRRGDGRRVHLQGTTPHRAPHPPHRSPGDACGPTGATSPS